MKRATKKVIRADVTKKDRYLAKLINQMILDDALTAKCHSANESERDLIILDYLIKSKRFHFEVTHDEVTDAYMATKVRSGKSRYLTEKNLGQAKYLMGHEKYAQAVIALSKAISKQPLITNEDFMRLSEIYLLRARMFEKLNDEEAWAYDLNFAIMAHRGIASQLTANENTLYSEYSNSYPTCCVDDGKMFYLNPLFEVIKNAETNEINLVAKEFIPEGTVVIRERPISKYSCTTFDNCACCDRYIRDFLYWPCQYCSEIVFCSQACWKKEFKHHAYECGLTTYLKQVPLFLLMIRFYARLFSDPSKQGQGIDYVTTFLEHIKKPSENIMKPNDPMFLFVFRQYMDRHKRLKEFTTKNRRNYYAVLIMAVEFLYLFDACIVNQAYIEEELKASAELAKAVTIRPEIGTFSWAQNRPTLLETTMVNVINCFEDLKRFIASPFSKFELMPTNFRENYRKERKVLLLTGLLFPEHQSTLTNLSPTFNTNTGMIEIKTSRNVYPNERLFLNRNMSVVPYIPF